MADLAKLVVRLEAQNQQLVKKLEQSQKKLGRFERSANKSTKKIRQHLNDVGKTAVTMAATAAAALAYLTVKTTAAVSEIEKAARVSNATTDEFQKMALGAARFGIEQDKLADILKDTNDRVGDFLTTGAGPMADFFEKIGPRIGVTAKDFANLSGPQALGLYVSSLEKANASQQEMTFFLEAMASDSTLLLPLLQQNGAALKAIGDNAERMGLIFSPEEIARAKQFDILLKQLEREVTIITQRFALELTPALIALGNILLDRTNETRDLRKQMEGVSTALVRGVTLALNFGSALSRVFVVVIEAARGVSNAVQSVLNELEAEIAKTIGRLESKLGLFKRLPGEVGKLFGAIGEASDFDFLEHGAETAEKAAEQAALARLSFLKLREALETPLAGDAFEDAFKQAVKDAEAITLPTPVVTGTGAGTPSEASVKATDQLKKLTEQMRQQAATAGLSEAATLKYRLTHGDLAEAVRLSGAAGAKYAAELVAIAEQTRALENAETQLENRQRATAEAFSEGQAVFLATRTAAEQYSMEQERLNKLLQQGAIDQGTYNRAVTAAQDSFDEAQRAAAGFGVNMKELGTTLGQNLNDSLTNFLFDPFADGTKSMGEQFSDLLRKMAAEVASAAIMEGLFGAGGVTSGGGAVGGFASLLGGFLANGGPAASNTPYLVGERGPELFIPNTSGTVHNTRDTAGMGGGTVTVNVTTPDADSFRASRRQIARTIKQGVAV